MPCPFVALFRIHPASYFGLPEGTKTVIPAGSGGIVGPVIDTRSRTLVSHGTLSRYREEAAKLALETSFGGTALKAWDNFFQITFEDTDLQSAITNAIPRIELLLQHLMVEHGDLYTFDFMQIEQVGGGIYTDPLPSPIDMIRVTMYNLDELKQRLLTAAQRASVTDERLGRALFYYEHSRLLMNLRGHVAVGSSHWSALLGAAYLNIWKSLTTILGDPSTDSDYQRRFRDFGFAADFWTTSVVPLKRVRDNSDVAHYSLAGTALEEVARAIAPADRLCRDVLKAYAEHLRPPAEPAPPDLPPEPTA